MKEGRWHTDDSIIVLSCWLAKALDGFTMMGDEKSTFGPHLVLDYLQKSYLRMLLNPFSNTTVERHYFLNYHFQYLKF